MDTLTTILYTANLRGDLDRLPRLYTFLLAQRRAAESSLLLDLGGSCDPAVWHCAVTGGRSTLLVLDAMGYDAANINDTLTAASRERLQANRLGMQVVAAGEAVTLNDVTLSPDPPARTTGPLHVSLSPAAATRLDGVTLYLAPVQAGQVGRVVLASDAGTLALAESSVLDLPPRTPPAPSIAATVDFVISEARYVQQQRES